MDIFKAKTQGRTDMNMQCPSNTKFESPPDFPSVEDNSRLLCRRDSLSISTLASKSLLKIGAVVVPRRTLRENLLPMSAIRVLERNMLFRFRSDFSTTKILCSKAPWSAFNLDF